MKIIFTEYFVFPSVVYDGCPKNFAELTWWDETNFDGTTVQPCPYGAQGQASRVCHREVGWGLPDMFNCVSDTFIELRDLVSTAAFTFCIYSVLATPF